LFAGEAKREVVFPSGSDWHDFWTGELIKGGATVTVDRAAEKIPVYVKAGSIVPWADVGAHTAAPESRRLSARVYGNGALSFRLEGDAGAEMRWSGGRGTVAGETDYRIHHWQRLG
jgi:alpha-D-xyloside xylohydrolase